MTVGRPPNILRPTKLTTYLPEDLRAKLDLYLYSDVEGRVPHGAYSKFLIERVKDFFDSTRSVKHSAQVPVEDTERTAKFLAMEGLLLEVALTDLRSGWTEERTKLFITEARRLTGRVPR